MIKTTEAKGNALERVITANYTTDFFTPTSITTPTQTITNLLNARGQILHHILTGSQAGSVAQYHIYTYYDNPSQSNYGLVQDYDAPRADINDHTSYIYDDNGNLISKTQFINNTSGAAVPRTTSYSNYNSAGLAQNITYPDGSSDVINYDNGFRVISTIHTAGSVKQVTGNSYDGLGRITGSTNEDHESTGYGYDELGRLTTKVKPNGNVERYFYHGNGVMSATGYHQPNGFLSKSEWQTIDNNGRVSSKRSGGDASIRSISISYDTNGNVIQTQSSQGIIEKWNYDALNRVISHTDGNGFIDTKGYDAGHNNILEKAANNQGSNRSFINSTYLSTESNSDFGIKSYQYNISNNIVIQQHANRRCTYGIYDQLGRNPQVDCASSNGQSHPDLQIYQRYFYDDSTFGNLDWVGTSDVDTHYSYDALHRVIAKKQQNKAGGSLLNTFYSYSSGGKLVSLTYPSGRTINYNYQNGMINNIAFNNGFIIRDIGINGADLLTGFHWGNGNDFINFGYTDAGVIKEISNVAHDGRDLTFGSWYDFDRDGRITKQNYSLNSNASTDYIYDNNDQLISESSSLYNVQYRYDQNGNRTELSANGSSGYPVANSQATCSFDAIAYADYYPDLKNAFGYNTDALRNHWFQYGISEGRTPCGLKLPYCSFNAGTYVSLWSDLVAAGVEGESHYRNFGINEGRGICPATNGHTAISYSYSANRLIDLLMNGKSQAISSLETGEISVGYAVAYDYAGRFRTQGQFPGQESNGNTSFKYNHKNERTLKVGRGLDRQYSYDENSQLLGEYDLSGNAIVEYIWLGNRPVAAIYPNNRIVYLVTDYQNKPRRGFDAQSGQLVWSWDPDAFGVTQPTGSVEMNLRFPGQVYDAQSGLYYNLNRYYSPQLGRYMEPDPIGLEGGLNPYSYAGNNPVMNVDPSGLDCIGGSCSTGFEQGMYDWWPGYKFGTGLYNSISSGTNQFSFWEGFDAISLVGFGSAKGLQALDNYIYSLKITLPEFRFASFSSKTKLEEHYLKHGNEFGNISKDEYLGIGQHLINNGYKVEYLYKGELRNGYLQFMGNNTNGLSKFAFAGTNNQGFITTIHTQSGKNIWRTINGNVADKVIKVKP